MCHCTNFMVLALLLATSCSTDSRNGYGPVPTPQPKPAGWQTYTDAAYGFSIDYPSEYVVLTDGGGSTATPAVQRVQFQLKDIANGPFADREPPQFSVQVFDIPGSQPLRDWLQATGRLPPGAVTTPIRLAGAREGLRVALPQLLAPNETTYVVGERYIYGLTPLGEDGERMLMSFRLGGR
jgi:hypothetical protein